MRAWKENNMLLREESEIRRLHRKNSTLTTRTIEVVKKLLKNISDYFCTSEEHSVADLESVYSVIFLENCFDLEEKHYQIQHCELAVNNRGDAEEKLLLNPTIEFMNVLNLNDNERTLDYIRTFGFPLIIKADGNEVSFTSKSFDTKSDWEEIRQQLQNLK